MKGRVERSERGFVLCYWSEGEEQEIPFRRKALDPLERLARAGGHEIPEVLEYEDPYGNRIPFSREGIDRLLACLLYVGSWLESYYRRTAKGEHGLDIDLQPPGEATPLETPPDSAWVRLVQHEGEPCWEILLWREDVQHERIRYPYGCGPKILLDRVVEAVWGRL